MRAEAGFRCERCGAPELPGPGHTLTVNQLINQDGYTTRANRVVLCRRCQGHLRAQPMGRLANQLEMFEPFELRWLQPHLDGLGIPVPGARSSSIN